MVPSMMKAAYLREGGGGTVPGAAGRAGWEVGGGCVSVWRRDVAWGCGGAQGLWRGARGDQHVSEEDWLTPVRRRPIEVTE